MNTKDNAGGRLIGSINHITAGNDSLSNSTRTPNIYTLQ